MRRPESELMTAGELKAHLEGLPDDARIFFGCFSLEFYRVKKRGENLYQIEFNQTVSDDENGNVHVLNHQ